MISDQEAISGEGLAFAQGVEVGHAYQPNPETDVGQHVVYFVDQILLKDPLLIHVGVSTMCDQFEGSLSGKKRVLGVRLLEVEAQRRHLAVELKAAEVAPCPDSHIQRNNATVVVAVGERGFVAGTGASWANPWTEIITPQQYTPMRAL